MMTKSDLVRRDVCRTESAVAIVVEFIFACDGCAAKVTTASRHAGRARNQLEGWKSSYRGETGMKAIQIEKFGNRTEVVRRVDIAGRDRKGT